MDKKSILKKVKKARARRVFIQVPEGLKTRVLELAEFLEERGIRTFISMERCYGSCDLRDMDARMLGADLILHLGHSAMGVSSRVPILYEECRMDFDPVPLLKRNLEKLKGYDKICLVTTLQFLDSLEKAKKFLESQGKVIKMGRPGKARYAGQILGCDHSAAKPLEGLVDCFLFLGSGRFHPLGLGLAVEKPVLFLDFEKGRLEYLDEEVQKLRIAKASRREWAKGCQTFGILLSTKPGQFELKTAERVRKELEAKGKKAYLLVFDEIRPEMLMGLKLDCLVNCACPRLSEDFESYGKIILEPGDIQ